MSVTFPYTIEQIEHKLVLIDENKNLLPYKYADSFPVGFEDVGDGSILTTTTTTSASNFFLNEVLLPAGVYTASIEVTTLLDSTSVSSHGFTLDIPEVNIDGSGKFTLSAETLIKVYLVPPTSSFSTGLVIKPQIEAGEVKTTWVPYMKTIGSYVDERFNGTNAKIKALNDTIAALNAKISALEDALADGVVLLAKKDAELSS